MSKELNAPISDLDEDLTSALVTYIREHRSEFRGIDGLERVYERKPKAEPAAPLDSVAGASRRRLRLKRWPRM